MVADISLKILFIVHTADSVQSYTLFPSPWQVVRSELDHQVPVRLGLERSAESLKVQVTSPNARKIEERIVEVGEAWQRLQGALTEREKGAYHVL